MGVERAAEARARCANPRYGSLFPTSIPVMLDYAHSHLHHSAFTLDTRQWCCRLLRIGMVRWRRTDALRLPCCGNLLAERCTLDYTDNSEYAGQSRGGLWAGARVWAAEPASVCCCAAVTRTYCMKGIPFCSCEQGDCVPVRERPCLPNHSIPARRLGLAALEQCGMQQWGLSCSEAEAT